MSSNHPALVAIVGATLARQSFLEGDVDWFPHLSLCAAADMPLEFAAAVTCHLLTRLVHLRAKGEILAIDAARFGAMSWLLPKPDLVFVVAADAREAAHPTHHVLNGGAPLSVLVDEVQRVIRMWMLARTAASLSNVGKSRVIAPTASAAH